MNRRTFALSGALLMAGGFLSPLTALGAELESVRMADTIKLGSQELVLNGMGLRTRFGLRVYVAGLYVGKKSGAVADLLTQSGPKRIAIAMRRNVDADTFLDALKDGIAANHNPQQLSALKDRIGKLSELILSIKEAKQGDLLDIDFIPDAGTQFMINNKPVGAPIPGEDFFQALLRIWIGEKPVQDGLKAGLIGKG
ncbi:MAG: hypothetical protein FGM18_07210 [Burkholderiaceae bacterium]|nr:hypothetical protein [Burkholderiaceae bacterium]